MLLDRWLSHHLPRRLLDEIAGVCGGVIVCDEADEVRRTLTGDPPPRCLAEGEEPNGAGRGVCLAQAHRDDGWFACPDGKGEHRLLSLSPAAGGLGWLVTGALDRAGAPPEQLRHLERLIAQLVADAASYWADVQLERLARSKLARRPAS